MASVYLLIRILQFFNEEVQRIPNNRETLVIYCEYTYIPVDLH